MDPSSRDSTSTLHEEMSTASPLIILTDIGRDIDDELSFILLASLRKMGLVDPIAIVPTLAPQMERAWLARGSLDALGMADVPVGIGSSGGVEDGVSLEMYGGTYSQPSQEIYENGADLLVRALESSPRKSVRFLCIASLTDVAKLMKNEEDLFLEKVKELVVMGGLKSSEPGEFVQPDSAYNNNCDMESANFVYRRCQELGIPTMTLSRWAAYEASVPTSLLDSLAETKHMVASNIRGVAESQLIKLWKKVNYPMGDPRREKLPARCNRHWFSRTFCGIDDVNETESSIWSQITKINMYDPLALLACVPFFRKRHFTLSTRMVNGVPHILSGVSNIETGIKDVVSLHDDLCSLFLSALKSECTVPHPSRPGFPVETLSFVFPKAEAA